MDSQTHAELNDGAPMPRVGLGTWPLVGDEAREIVGTALELGYRLIDTSEQYGNEEAVGAAVRESTLPREEIFVTTKFNAKWHGLDLVADALEGSLERLGLDYVDLFLIHWPNPWQDRYVEAWEGMLPLRERGLARSVGVSNFLPSHLDRLIEATGVAPAVNQIELDPTLSHRARREYHLAHGILTEAWSPLGRGGDLLTHPVVLELADWRGKSPAQVLLRWQIEIGAAFVARSTNARRLAANIDIFDFSLGQTGMRAMDGLDAGRAPARDSETHGH